MATAFEAFIQNVVKVRTHFYYISTLFLIRNSRENPFFLSEYLIIGLLAQMSRNVRVGIVKTIYHSRFQEAALESRS